MAMRGYQPKQHYTIVPGHSDMLDTCAQAGSQRVSGSRRVRAECRECALDVSHQICIVQSSCERGQPAHADARRAVAPRQHEPVVCTRTEVRPVPRGGREQAPFICQSGPSGGTDVISVNEVDLDLVYSRKLLGAGVDATGRTVLGACYAGDLMFRAAIAEMYAATIQDLHRFATTR
jgi:hypothetical protein